MMDGKVWDPGERLASWNHPKTKGRGEATPASPRPWIQGRAATFNSSPTRPQWTTFMKAFVYSARRFWYFR